MELTTRLLDLLLPPTCPNCRSITAEPHVLCSACWKGMNFVTDPCCKACGWPFEYVNDINVLCGACSRQLPLFTQGRFVMAYDELSKGMIVRFKHMDATHLAPTFAKMMAHKGKDILSTTDYLMPVPLYRWRFFKRGYNQAALLTRIISRSAKKPALFDVLRKVRSTKPQAGLNHGARQSNIKGVFELSKRKAELVRHKIVTVIDDVWTTGATLTEISQVLLRAGAQEVRVLTLARVLNNGLKS